MKKEDEYMACKYDNEEFGCQKKKDKSSNKTTLLSASPVSLACVKKCKDFELRKN